MGNFVFCAVMMACGCLKSWYEQIHNCVFQQSGGTQFQNKFFKHTKFSQFFFIQNIVNHNIFYLSGFGTLAGWYLCCKKICWFLKVFANSFGVSFFQYFVSVRSALGTSLKRSNLLSAFEEMKLANFPSPYLNLHSLRTWDTDNHY